MTMITEVEPWAKLVSDLATIGVAATAFFGISAWRREHIGKRKAELAEETLTAFYQAVDAIRHIRSPMGLADEGATRKVTSEETPEQKAARDSANVVYVRYNQYADVFARIRASRYRFKAFFGKAAAKPFDDLNDLLHEIFVAAQMLSRLWDSSQTPHGEEAYRRYLDQLEKFEAVFWQARDPDPIDERLTKIVAEIEIVCRPALVERGRINWLRDLIERGAKALEEAQHD